MFTNVLNEGVPGDEAVVSRVAQLAATRGDPYVPVELRCAKEEILRRVNNDDRRSRMKWVDPDAVRSFMEAHRLLRLDRYKPIELDMTTLPPERAVAQVLQHVRSL